MHRDTRLSVERVEGLQQQAENLERELCRSAPSATSDDTVGTDARTEDGVSRP